MARRKESGFDLIAAAPWPVGIVLGVLAYFGVRYGFTLLAAFTGNPILAGIGNFAQNSNGYRMLAWIALGLCWIAALASFIGRKRRRRLLETQTGLDSLRAMSWRQFEMLVGEAFRRQGYRIEETGLGGADGGVDLLLRKDGRTTLVQCKQWRAGIGADRNQSVSKAGRRKHGHSRLPELRHADGQAQQSAHA